MRIQMSSEWMHFCITSAVEIASFKIKDTKHMIQHSFSPCLEPHLQFSDEN